MNTVILHLSPGEHCIYHIQRSRKWNHLLLTTLLDTLAMAAVWFLFQKLDQALVDSYMKPANLLGRADFMALNLFMGVVPILIVLALIQDFLYTFFIELSLTDRRIYGKACGPVWLKDVNIPLEDIQSMSAAAGYLVIQLRGRGRLLLSGFNDVPGFIDAFQKQRLGLDPSFEDLPDGLPDAFTFGNAP